MRSKPKSQDAPSGLAPEESKLWLDITARYELEAAQLSALENACRLLSQARAFDKIVAKEGPIISTSKGAREHPASVGARLNRNAANAALSRLGLFNVGRDS